MDAISIIGVVLALIAVVVSIVIYLKELRRSRLTDTIREINELFDFYHNMKDKKDYKERIHFMSKVDRFAVAVNEKLYDKKMTKRRAGKFLLRLYDDFMDEYIAQRRNQFGDDSYYENIVLLIEKLK